jgi:hypothetical protein
MRNRVGGLDVHRDSVTGCVEIFDGVEVEIAKEKFATVRGHVKVLVGGQEKSSRW